jgi:shikimate dehydrogenase
MQLFGLIGKNLAHSFSEKFFSDKFKREGIDALYKNFELSDIAELKMLIEKEPGLHGLNVTIPFKEQVLNLVDETDDTVTEIGAANCLVINRSGKKFSVKAFNTDAPAFLQTLQPWLKPHHRHALILGTGGASKAVHYALKKIPQVKKICFVSRSPANGMLSYQDLKDKKLFSDFQIIINTTPLGMFPDGDSCPDIPYTFLNRNTLLYDLVYNPQETLFMRKAKTASGCHALNGMAMLIKQAELSWEIWSR